jgi:hypothetical protein
MKCKTCNKHYFDKKNKNYIEEYTTCKKCSAKINDYLAQKAYEEFKDNEYYKFLEA